MDIFLKHDLSYLQGRSCYFHWLQPIRRNLAQHHLVPCSPQPDSLQRSSTALMCCPTSLPLTSLRCTRMSWWQKKVEGHHGEQQPLHCDEPGQHRESGLLSGPHLDWEAGGGWGVAANGEVLKKDTHTPPLLAIKDWSQREAAMFGWPRTNNSSEG